jgi:hypothetical protein
MYVNPARIVVNQRVNTNPSVIYSSSSPVPILVGNTGISSVPVPILVGNTEIGSVPVPILVGNSRVNPIKNTHVCSKCETFGFECNHESSICDLCTYCFSRGTTTYFQQHAKYNCPNIPSSYNKPTVYGHNTIYCSSVRRSTVYNPNNTNGTNNNININVYNNCQFGSLDKKKVHFC